MQKMMTKAMLTTLGLALCSAAPALGETVLFQDDFSGLSTDALDGTTPDVTQGTTAWSATTHYAANGSITAATTGTTRFAYLSMGGLIDDSRGTANAIYTLSASLDVEFGATNTQWEALGFWTLDTPGNNFASFTPGTPNIPASGTAWMLRRGNADIRVFNGLGTSNTVSENTATPNDVAGAVDLQIILDLSDWNGTDNFGSVTYNAKLSSTGTYTQVATGELVEANSSFRAVGLGGGGVGATVSSFQLTQVPEPSSLALLGLGGLLIARRRRN